MSDPSYGWDSDGALLANAGADGLPAWTGFIPNPVRNCDNGSVLADLNMDNRRSPGL